MGKGTASHSADCSRISLISNQGNLCTVHFCLYGLCTIIAQKAILTSRVAILFALFTVTGPVRVFADCVVAVNKNPMAPLSSRFMCVSFKFVARSTWQNNRGLGGAPCKMRHVYIGCPLHGGICSEWRYYWQALGPRKTHMQNLVGLVHRQKVDSNR